MNLTFFSFDDSAIFPTRGTSGSAGYDLYSNVDIIIQPGKTALVKTDIGVILPEGFYGRIAPRSSLAYKHSIDVFAGVIDYDYRGALGVVIYNSSDVEFAISRGDRIAQLIIERCLGANEVSVNTVTLKNAETLPEWSTLRADGGFGSTGK